MRKLLTNEKEHTKYNFCWREEGKSRDLHNQTQSESFTAFMPILLAKKKKIYSHHQMPSQHYVFTTVMIMLFLSLQLLAGDAKQRCTLAIKRTIVVFQRETKCNADSKTSTMRIVAFGELLAEKVSQKDVPPVFSSGIYMMS